MTGFTWASPNPPIRGGKRPNQPTKLQIDRQPNGSVGSRPCTGNSFSVEWPLFSKPQILWVFNIEKPLITLDNSGIKGLFFVLLYCRICPVWQVVPFRFRITGFFVAARSARGADPDRGRTGSHRFSNQGSNSGIESHGLRAESGSSGNPDWG